MFFIIFYVLIFMYRGDQQWRRGRFRGLLPLSACPHLVDISITKTMVDKRKMHLCSQHFAFEVPSNSSNQDWKRPHGPRAAWRAVKAGARGRSNVKMLNSRGWQAASESGRHCRKNLCLPAASKNSHSIKNNSKG